MPAAAKEVALAFVRLHPDADFASGAVNALKDLIAAHSDLQINTEFKLSGVDHVTLVTGGEAPEVDLGLHLVEEGALMVEGRRDIRLQKIINEYFEAQDAAKRAHVSFNRYISS